MFPSTVKTKHTVIVVFLVAVAGAGVIASKTIGYTKKIGYFEELIQSASSRHNVDPCLVKAVVKQESQFDQYALGMDGEIGLMQITPMAVRDWERIHHRRLGLASALYAPKLNIEIGTWYLGTALKQWHNHEDRVTMALIQYNAGRSRALNWARKYSGETIRDVIPFKSTRYYIRNVLYYYSHFLRKNKVSRGLK